MSQSSLFSKSQLVYAEATPEIILSEELLDSLQILGRIKGFVQKFVGKEFRATSAGPIVIRSLKSSSASLRPLYEELGDFALIPIGRFLWYAQYYIGGVNMGTQRYANGQTVYGFVEVADDSGEKEVVAVAFVRIGGVWRIGAFDLDNWSVGLDSEVIN